MNSNLMAFLAAVIVAVSGGVLAAAMQADAADDPDYGAGTSADPWNLGSVILDITGDPIGAATAPLKFNESAYQYYADYKFVLNAHVSTNDATVYDSKDAVPKNNVPVGGFKLTLEAVGSTPALGDYTVTVKEGTDLTAGTYLITFDLNVYVAPILGADYIPLDPFFYELTVKVTNDGNLTITVEEENTVTFTEDDNKSVELNVTDVIVSNYTWYAIGLPEGLNIIVNDGKLYITGMATAVFESKTVDIVARDANGSEFHGTIQVQVTDTDFEYTLKYGGDSGDALKHVADVWIAESDKTVVLQVTGAKVEGVQVVNMIDGQYRADAPGNQTSGYTISTGGDGLYTIEVTYNGGLMKEIQLHVIPSTAGSGAGFIVIGG